MKKKSYSYNTRNWEKRHNVYNVCITIKEEDLSKKDLEKVKNTLKEQGLSLSKVVIRELSKYIED